MNNELLDGFYLKKFLVEPLLGRVSGAGEPVHLSSKSVEVLLCLAKNPRSLVTKEEILGKVWGDGQGSADGLSHAVGEIRHALDDHADHPEFVQTVPKRGYRLLCEPRLKNRPPDAESMATAGPGSAQIWQSLLRRGVMQASLAYLVVGWLLIQVAGEIFSDLGLPQWAIPFVTFVVVGGLPIVVLLSWFLESSEGRMHRDRGEQSGGLLKGLERNYLAIIGAYAIAIVGIGLYQLVVGIDVFEEVAEPVIVTTDLPPIPVEANSIAMLKLLNIDGSESTRVFSDGLSEDILDRLAAIPGLLVSSRGDAWSLPRNAPSEIVRRRLRVAYFVEGSVRLVGSELRVIVQLINSETGFHVVSRSFNRSLQDFMAMQSEITDLIVANLRVALPDETQTTMAFTDDSENLDAYVFFRRGREALNKPSTTVTIRESLEMFRQSLAIDPEYAAAHAGTCRSYTDLYELTHDSADIDTAEEACAAALSVNSQLHMVHSALGRLFMLTGRTAEAESSYLKSLQINKKSVGAMQGLAGVYRRQQRLSEAESLLSKAIELQPGNWATINRLGNFMFGLGRYDEAADQYRKVVYLDPNNWTTLGNLGSVLMMTGDFAAARQAIERSLKIEANQTFYSNLGTIFYYLGEFDQAAAIQRQVLELSPNSNFIWLNLADALYFSGDEEAARDAFKKSAELSQGQLSVNPTDAETMYFLAWAQAMIGDYDEPLELIDRAIATAPNDSYAFYYDALLKTRRGDLSAATEAIKTAVQLGYPLQMVAAEPHLADLRGEKEFVELLEGETSNN